MPRLKLIEIFKEYNPTITGGSQHSKYRAEYAIIKRKDPKKVTLEDLEAYIEKLQQRYPNHAFYLMKVSVVDEEELEHANQRLQYYRQKPFRTPIDTAMIQHYKTITENPPKKTLYAITRKSRDPKGNPIKQRIPIYFHLESQRFYIPKTYIKTRPKLAAYITMRVLGTLGISKTKYVRTLGRRK